MCFMDIDYKICVNDSQVGPIVPSRGLRQGDPLSPYLFLFEASAIKTIMGTYEVASGQSINLTKSGILFSPSIPAHVTHAISGLLDVTLPLTGTSYLGLPSLIDRTKKHIFTFLKDRVWKRMNHWNSRFLSRAGREILIKFVAQAIPAYCMNVFLLPASCVTKCSHV
ncbi:hypothetical protein K2173_000288 [Erythroxylum novogranatense]|uniref:Reverse transcriptase domain-containing protein n=1 Tax=Erythroxylum novogranatense TaxID=1862640 RepID=A0AAV8SW20_9ROSI|nr:hypothetical protein K2173_000288 [Erythroxylum novogranatense]